MKNFTSIQKHIKNFYKRLKKFYLWLDKLLDLREQAIGWTATAITFLIICWLINILDGHPEWILWIKNYYFGGAS